MVMPGDVNKPNTPLLTGHVARLDPCHGDLYTSSCRSCQVSLGGWESFVHDPARGRSHAEVIPGLPFSITSEGLERTFATNYLGPFLLTNLLLDTMKGSAPARIVNVSSFRHVRGTANVKHLSGEERPKNFDQSYNSTKLMNILFTNELARRLQGTGVTANSINPGIVRTEIMRHFNWLVRLLFSITSIFFMSAEEGATSTIYCAVSEEVADITGKYFDSDCRLVLPCAAARDPGLERKLWEESERLTGLTESGRM
nr:retinol dehydrogenase 13 [Chrysemys picta bellii]